MPELVRIQPLELEAHPVRRLKRVVGVGLDVLPIEALDKSVLGGVAPAPRLVGRLPEVDVGDALALHVSGVATHLYRTVDALELPGEVPQHPLPLGRQNHVPIPLQRVTRLYVRERPV